MASTGGARASADGAIRCWGDDRYGELGNGTLSTSTAPDDVTPVSVPGLGNVSAIAGGGYHTCALLSSGAVDCWGDNTYGELGNGTTTDSSTPVRVTGL
jgi:alpha-tubulin suppressor-like RCC1 family protein